MPNWKHCLRAFTPVLAKHSKSFNLIDTLAVGVDRIQRNFEPMQRQVERWRSTQITDQRAKLILYAAWRGPCGACRMRLPARSSSSIQFHTSRRQQNWVSSWRLSSRRPLSDEWQYRPDRRSFTTLFYAAGVARTPASLTH